MVDAVMWSAPVALLGRLVSVRRALVWATLGGEQAAAARFLGANCVRLVDQVLAADGLSEAQRQALGVARVHLAEIDATEGEARLTAIRASGHAMDQIVPLSQLDGGLPSDDSIRPRARLIVPAEGEKRESTPSPAAHSPGSAPVEAARAAPQAAQAPQKARAAEGQSPAAPTPRAAPPSAEPKRAEPRQEPKPETKPETRPDPKTESRADPKPEPEARAAEAGKPPPAVRRPWWARS